MPGQKGRGPPPRGRDPEAYARQLRAVQLRGGNHASPDHRLKALCVRGAGGRIDDGSEEEGGSDLRGAAPVTAERGTWLKERIGGRLDGRLICKRQDLCGFLNVLSDVVHAIPLL